MAHITIDGRGLEVQDGITVLQAAQQQGIDIPTLCHHPMLSDIGACRMCLVEVSKQRGLQPACTFPVSDGMEVLTETPKVVAARRFVLELLFSERNHYCMFCQMSGDCELQALAYRYGLEHWTYDRPRTSLPVDATRRYFALDHNRCILCRRCIRACAEVAHNHTLGERQRGTNTMVSADLGTPLGESTCVSCGTCLQVCPTGALIDRQSAYRGRETEVVHSKSVCAACSVGCGIDVVHRGGHIVRIDGDWEAEPSHGLLCARGRFEPLDEVRRRVDAPQVRRGGQLVETDWGTALGAAAEGLDRAQVTAAVTTGRATNETFQALAGAFERAGIWHRPPAALEYTQAVTLADIEAADVIVVAGAEPSETHRVVAYFIRRALDHGARLYTIDSRDGYLASFAALSGDEGEAQEIARRVADASAPVVIYGAGLGPRAAEALKAPAGSAAFLLLPEGANALGAAAAGIGPWKGPDKADALYVLAGDDPVEPAALPKADFVVVQSAYRSALTERADVVLPSPTWAERAGHLTSLDGRTRQVDAILPAPQGVWAEWQPLVRLAEMLGRGRAGHGGSAPSKRSV